MLKRVCHECGITFDGGPTARFCPKCREVRTRAWLSMYRRRGAARHIGYSYPCEICGELYVLASGTQRFCERCAPAHYKEVSNSLCRAWRGSHPVEFAENRKTVHDNWRLIADEVTAAYSMDMDITRLASLRDERGITRHALAKAAGISFATLDKYEIDPSCDPLLYKLECIAFGLGMIPRDLWRYLYHDVDRPLFRGGGYPYPSELTADLARVELLRTRKGMTAHALSIKSGSKSRRLIYKIEAGAQSDIYVSSIERIAAALDMRPLDLLLFLYD